MSLSLSTKRKASNSETASGSLRKRKIRSCEACRRLKTRCEIQIGSSTCRRCEVLTVECSFTDVAEDFIPRKSESSKLDDHHVQKCSGCNERISALESSVARLEALLSKQPPLLEQSLSPSMLSGESGNHSETRHMLGATPQKPLPTRPLAADHNSRTAPMSLIRDMTQHIIGTERARPDSYDSDDVIFKGIITEEMAGTLLTGFSKISRRWLFMKSTSMAAQRTSPLLFSTCVLAGLHIDPSLHGSEIHQALYKHASDLISRSILVSPLSLEAIQSMFIFSMWNLVPNKDSEHIDSWFLSGMAAMHGMLAINFEELMQVKMDGSVDPRSREALRSWNLICLCHLQFCVGTGRPPVISRQYLTQCENILNLPSYNSRDQLVAAGVRLYDSLCGLVNSNVVQTESVTWKEIDDWKISCGQFYNLDSSKPLRFAYSCCYLILSRRTLKHLSKSEQPSSDTTDSSDSEGIHSRLFVHAAIDHANNILELFLAMSDLTSFVRPAYENLLCSYAMVTLSEFSSYLENAETTLNLMEKTSFHVQLGGKAEPVSQWAINVLRKFVLDSKPAHVETEGMKATDFGSAGRDMTKSAENSMQFMGNFGGDSFGLEEYLDDFPSLEEMFLGN